MYIHCKLFDGLTQSTIQDLLQQVPHTLKSYEPQETIFTEIDFNQQLGLLVKGKAHVYKTLSIGNELLMATLEANELFGLSCIWGNSEYFPSTIKSITSCRVLFLSRDSLKKLFSLEPLILDNFMNCVSKKLLYLNDKIEMLAIPSAKERLLYVISQSCSHQKGIKINKTKLCKELSISRASLYRCLEQLQEEQHILIDQNNKIHLI